MISRPVIAVLFTVDSYDCGLQCCDTRERTHATQGSKARSKAVARMAFQSMSPHQILVSSKWRGLVILAIDLVFVAAGIAILANDDLFGLVVIAFFGLGLYLAFASLLRPARLTLSDREFKFDAQRRHSTYEYAHCGEFRVMNNVALNPKLIVFQYDGPGKPPRFGRRLSANGVRLAAVPSTFQMSASDVAELLNARRAAFRSGLE